MEKYSFAKNYAQIVFLLFNHRRKQVNLTPKLI